MNKTLALIAVSLLFLQQSYAATYYTVNEDQINIRSDSTVNSPSLGTLAKGEVVEANQRTHQWCKIKLPPRFKAYVWKTYVKRLSKNRGEVLASRLNMRQEPSLEAAIIGQIPRNETVTVVGSAGDWLQISAYPFATAWVHGKFLTETSRKGKEDDILSPEEVLLSNFITESIESLLSAEREEKNQIIKEIVAKGDNVITFIDREIDPDNEPFTYAVIDIFTQLGKNNPALISYFLKKAESTSLLVSSIYLDVLQNILETKGRRTTYYYLAKEGRLTAGFLEKVIENYNRIHKNNILSRKRKNLP
jgi:uncharacterized protein YgiM (DUF1202 family)